MSIHHIDEIFNKSSTDQQVPVPDHLWSRVERQLDQKNNTSPELFRILLPWIGIAATCLFLVMWQVRQHNLFHHTTTNSAYIIEDLETNSEQVKFTAEIILNLRQYRDQQIKEVNHASSSASSLNG